MGDLVAPTINLIEACITKYNDFCAFKEECVTFRQSLCNVIEVLEDVQKELLDGKAEESNTRLRRPMELLQAATNDGGEVLRKCSAKHKLLAFVFSRQLMGMLNKAKADIHEAMRLLQVSSVRIQVSTRRVMDCVSDQLVELHKQINASYTSKHEVADLIRAEMQQHRESHGASIAVALSDVLVKMGVVSSAQDCADQFLELQREADSIRKAKVIYDEEMLEAVKALTAPRPQADAPSTAQGLEPSQRQGSDTSSAVQECMVCPISGDIMRDPVTVMESGLTYDRKSLCKSLLTYPDLEPATGQRFDHPLHYTPSIAIRNMITSQYGDSFYQKYDDAEFKEQYEIKWMELVSPPLTVATVKDEGRRTADGAATSDTDSIDVKFGGSKETDRVDTMSSDADDLEEAAGKPGAESEPGETYRACWRSRRAKCMVAGAVLVVLVVIVGIMVRAIKRGSPSVPSASSATSNSALRPSASPTIAKAIAPSSSPSSSETLSPTSPPSASPTSPPSASPTSPPSTSPTPPPTPSPTMTPAEKFSSTLPPYTTESLQDTSSPQYRAYEVVTQSDQIPSGDEATMLFRMTQRFALATFFYSLELDSWVKPAESECEWGNATTGSNVTCNADSEVVALDPDGAGSVPTPIPREIGLLTNLVYLDLSYNELTSSIPTELGRLNDLTSLNLENNALLSSIPTELGLLSFLTFLDLSDNSLTLSIPTELGRLAVLESLFLNGNELTSSIPTELGRLSNLEQLELQVNLFVGSIPSALCSVDGIDIVIDCAEEVTCSCCRCYSP